MVQDIRKKLNTSNFFNDSVIEINGSNLEGELDKNQFKSIRDTNYLHIENNRRIINENMKKIKQQKCSNIFNTVTTNNRLFLEESSNNNNNYTIKESSALANEENNENDDMNINLNLNILMK